MAEYIERSAAIEAAKHAWAKGLEPSQYIEALPAADVTPVTHGEWIEDDYGYNHCSACGWEWDEPETVSPYCLHCGTKMDGGEKRAAD